MRRALIFFSHFGIDAEAAPADRLDASIGVFPNSLNFTMMDIALHESLGVLQYHFYNLMGWNG
jgi:uncharacterized SAM-binding protein YcdF (DUF218 family)